jgi:hypothetical protein
MKAKVSSFQLRWQQNFPCIFRIPVHPRPVPGINPIDVVPEYIQVVGTEIETDIPEFQMIYVAFAAEANCAVGCLSEIVHIAGQFYFLLTQQR